MLTFSDQITTPEHHFVSVALNPLCRKTAPIQRLTLLFDQPTQ